MTNRKSHTPFRLVQLDWYKDQRPWISWITLNGSYAQLILRGLDRDVLTCFHDTLEVRISLQGILPNFGWWCSWGERSTD